MNKNIKLFTNHSAYNAVKDQIDKPNVVMCQSENEVHYNPDLSNGHAYVDLGLPSGTLWATMNIGATSVTDGGTSFTVRPGTLGVSTTENDTAYLNWGGNWRIPTEQQFQELFDNCTYNGWGTIDGSDNPEAARGCTFTSNVNVLVSLLKFFLSIFIFTS